MRNILASMRYTMSRYGSLPAGYDRRGGYKLGTQNAIPGAHWVGEAGPELVTGPTLANFSGGQSVAPVTLAPGLTTEALSEAVASSLTDKKLRIDLDNGVAWFEAHLSTHNRREDLRNRARRGRPTGLPARLLTCNGSTPGGGPTGASPMTSTTWR